MGFSLRRMMVLCFTFHTADSSLRLQRLHAVFNKPMTEIYLLFYQLALQTFVHFNKFLQREDPLLPILLEQMKTFLNKLASKFLLPCTIKAAKRDFSTLKYMEDDHQHPGKIPNRIYNMYIPILCFHFHYRYWPLCWHAH